MYPNYFLACLLIPILFLSGCSDSSGNTELIDTHYLRYQIEYLEDKAGDIPTRILPGHMDAFYANSHILSRIEGFFSQFSLVQIADLRQRRVTTMLSFFGNKVYSVGRHGELPAAVVNLGKYSCNYTGETSIIGGLKSEKVEVDTGTEQYDIYITKDFSVRRPNISTPYRSIDYPLSEFRVQLSHLKMKLSCCEFEAKTVESEFFTIPEDYQKVSNGDMEDIINSLFTNE